MLLDLGKYDLRLSRPRLYIPPSGSAVETGDFHSQWTDTYIEPELVLRFFEQQAALDSARGVFPYFGEGPLDDIQIAAAHEETSSDLALKAAELLLADDRSRAEIDVLIHFHMALDQRPSWATACRLQHELKLTSAVPLSIGQKGQNAGFAAVKTAAEALAAEPDTRRALLVGADKFAPPYRSAFAALARLSDGACALLLTRGEGPLRVLSVGLHDGLAEVFGGSRQLLNRVADLTRDFLKAAGKIVILTLSNAAPWLAGPLAALTGVSSAQVHPGTRTHYFGVSDLACGLASALNASGLRAGDRLLAIGLSTDASVSFLLAEYCGRERREA